ncbi:hypothetical protein NE237_017649 [Protea cynaroides]|uniref:C2H2-type domain-containing protein n=1 Tax=Protea cynaroides TaxID=273540 RepID=A0A9Q0QN59_9MAGN|nr:hypothetical protein NE237_017649 [Protea cynaroides]
MWENIATKNHHQQQHQVFDFSIDVHPQEGSKCFDDDDLLKRTENFRNQRQTWRSFIVIEWDKVDFFQLLLHILTTTRHVRASYLWTIFSNSSTYILECRKVFQFASNLRKHEHSHEMKSQSTHESKHSLRSDHFPVEFVDVTRSSNTDM